MTQPQQYPDHPDHAPTTSEIYCIWCPETASRTLHSFHFCDDCAEEYTEQRMLNEMEGY